MKAKEYRKQLDKKLKENPKKSNPNFKGDKEDKLKIIGITGSKGKSGVAYIINKYLKEMNYKTVLYSSIMIDSNLSYCLVDEAVETPIRNEQMLLDAVSEALDYEADYLILEINESTLSKNIIDLLDFDIKVLTNIVPKQNNILYENYVDLKKSFLKNAKNGETLVLGLVDLDTISLYNELKNKNIVTFSTNYIISKYELNKHKVDYYVQESTKDLESINGISFNIMDKKSKLLIESSLLFGYNALNIICAYSVIDSMKLLDKNLFLRIINNLQIPGREEYIKVNNRLIIISLTCVPHLNKLKTFKHKGQINDILIVTGAAGYGYINWHKEISLEKYLEDKEYSMKFAYNYISQNADKVYVTVSDTGSVNVEEWLDYQIKLIDSKITSEKLINRREAIKKALIDSKEGDVIFIAGRGNRRIMCDGNNHIISFLDKNVLMDILEELNWEV